MFPMNNNNERNIRKFSDIEVTPWCYSLSLMLSNLSGGGAANTQIQSHQPASHISAHQLHMPTQYMPITRPQQVNQSIVVNILKILPKTILTFRIILFRL